MVARKLNISFYDKKKIKEYALRNHLVNKDITEGEVYDEFLSLDVNKEAMIQQTRVIKVIVNIEDAVIIGRASDSILEGNKNLIKVFIYAPIKYRMKNYGDNEKQSKEHIINSDKARSNYYSIISNQVWGEKNNYDLYIDASIGNEEVVKIIRDYIKNKEF